MRLLSVFLAGLMAAWLTAPLASAEPGVMTEKTSNMPTPLIHMTDLYQPPCDPDDHWDLATVYALAKQGRVRLLGVVLDYPLQPDPFGFVPLGAGEPAVQAVAQMNYITGLAVPAVLGVSVPFDQVESGKAELSGSDAACVDFVIDQLRQSPDPVAIAVAGSCRNVALAARIAPEVFKEKCRGIYLNAGTARINEQNPDEREWNVALDPGAYRFVFDIPCPVYWLPCFESPGQFVPSQHGSYWNFRQGDILPELSQPVQSYLMYALTRSTEQRWLSALRNGIQKEALATQGSYMRNMWCTVGFLHMAGLGVSREGKLVDLGSLAPENALYNFEPVTVELNGSGVSKWEKATAPDARYIIEVEDTDEYVKHMRNSLRSLLTTL